MAYPLINPLIQFFDGSGAPLDSGTIEFRNPDTDALIPTYPTADDADAATNANSNPLTLNSRGEASSGIYLVENTIYKIVLKDSDGATIWTQDDVRCPSRAAWYSGTPQTLTDAGAVNLTTSTTWVVTTGAAALTLADGSEGQRKFIVMKTDGGAATLTPTNLGNGTTITFDDVGDSADLLFTNDAWHFMGGTATLA